MATSPRKSPTPKRPIESGPTKPRISVKPSTKGKSGDETQDESTQETEKRTKAKKSASRKAIKAADSDEGAGQGAMPATTFRINRTTLPPTCSRIEQEETF